MTGGRIELSRLWKGDLTAREHLNVPAVLVLDGAFSILGAAYSLDIDSRTFILLTLDREVHVYAQLTVLNVSIGDAESVE